MKYFSMFSGIGGFELGIQKQTNWQCVGFSEINKYAISVYQNHFKNHKNYGDATKINTKELPEFELLVGGFPCQAFSVAGKRQGFNDTRGTLFFELARILKDKRPRYFIFENVKGLLSHDFGKTLQTIIGVLTDIGYRVQWQVLNSKDFGVPQSRERVYIVGNLREERRPEIFPIYKKNDQTITAGKKEALAVLTPERIKKRQNGRRFKGLNEPMFTLTGQDIHGIYDGVRIRKLTPIECERLQGFPDNWADGLSDTQRYKTLGNAVTVNVVESIVKKLMIKKV